MPPDNKRGGLGKGLSALLPSSTPSLKGSIFFYCEIEKIRPRKNQPRKDFENIQELADSIREKGILQPLVVRKLDDGYEILAGERRFRAAQHLKLREVPVVVKTADEKAAMEIALIENIQREDLNPMEEAHAYRDLMDSYHLTQEEVSKKLGKDRATIANTMRLIKLPAIIQEMVVSGKLSAGHARSLLALEKVEEQIVLAKEIVAKGLSVRKVEELIKQMNDGGEVAITASPKREPTQLPVFLSRVQGMLHERLATKVAVNHKKKSLTISFADEQDLAKILERMGIATIPESETTISPASTS